MAERFLTTGEVAKHCQVSPVTVFRWIKDGRLPAHTTPGGHYRVAASDLLAFLTEHAIPVDTELGRQTSDARRILVVDDEELVVETIVRNLQRSEWDFEFAKALNGFEAGRQLGLFSPDLVVLDLKMPGIDGLEVCRQVKGDPKTQRIKILVVTGFASPDQLQRARAAGADDCLPKPFTGAELRRKVANLLGLAEPKGQAAGAASVSHRV